MTWKELRHAYPDQWIVLEALEAYTTPDRRRLLEQVANIESCPDGITAFNQYRVWQRRYPDREFYYLHTSREHVNIQERSWPGIRAPHALSPQR